jgi:cation transport regulator
LNPINQQKFVCLRRKPMNHFSRENLPEDIKNVLPEEAQGMFIAAYNSFLDNSQDEEAAKRVAWQTIEHSALFERGPDGKFRQVDIYDGGHERPLASAPNA